MGKPDCFGNLWSAQAVECRGGYDPNYMSTGGSNIRPVCDYFQSCGAQKSARKVSQSFQVPVTNLTRGTPPAALSTSVKRPAFLSTPQNSATPVTRGVPVGHEVIQMNPVEMVPSNWYTVPSMLATLEPMEQFSFRNAALTMGRGAAVGALMSLAHFISNAPFTRHGGGEGGG